MTHERSPQFWIPKYQEGMSLEALHYRRLQDRELELLTVRETAANAIAENWARLRAEAKQ